VTAWDEYRAQAEEYRELDSERVLVLAHFAGRGKRSGVELEQLRTRGAAVFHLKGGQVVRIVRYWDRERALADLGLSSERA
jgi:ketosteroid isomerase-like protein